MNNRTILVAFDMNYEDRKAFGLHELNAEKTIQYLCYRIQEVCEELQKKHPDNPWIIAWPEHGIHYISNILSFTSAQKKELKKQLSALCWQYPQLTIIAGSMISTKKTSLIKSEELQAYYKQHPWLEMHEPFIKQREPLEDFIANLKSLAPDEKEKKEKAGMIIVRNTCFIVTGAKIFLMKSPPLSADLKQYANSYIFTKEPLALVYVDQNHHADILQIQDKVKLASLLAEAKLDRDYPLQRRTQEESLIQQFVEMIKANGRDHIKRIDKISPFEELQFFSENHFGVPSHFKLGGKKGRNMEHIFGDVGVEICLETRSGVLKHELEEQKLAPLKLQCVVSNSTTIDISKIAAEFVWHIDTQSRPCLYTMKNSQDEFVFYVHRFASNKEKNLTLKSATYPFVSYFLESIEQMKLKTQDKNIIQHLDRYKEAVQAFESQEILLTTDDQIGYSQFKKLLKGMYSDAKLKQFAKDGTLDNIYEKLINRRESELRSEEGPMEEKLVTAKQSFFSQQTAPETPPGNTSTLVKKQQQS